jgi:hypothetical protein
MNQAGYSCFARVRHRAVSPIVDHRAGAGFRQAADRPRDGWPCARRDSKETWCLSMALLVGVGAYDLFGGSADPVGLWRGRESSQGARAADRALASSSPDAAHSWCPCFVPPAADGHKYDNKSIFQTCGGGVRPAVHGYPGALAAVKRTTRPARPSRNLTASTGSSLSLSRS